jgi:hypothetical protein
MLTDFLYSIVFGLVTTLLGALPSFDLTPASELGGPSAPVTTLLHDAGLKVGRFDPWLNSTLLLTCLDIALALYGSYVVVTIALWVYRHLPGKGT